MPERNPSRKNRCAGGRRDRCTGGMDQCGSVQRLAAVWTDISEIRSYEWKISEEDKDELEEKMICNQKDSIQENAIFTLEDYVRVIKGM